MACEYQHFEKNKRGRVASLLDEEQYIDDAETSDDSESVGSAFVNNKQKSISGSDNNKKRKSSGKTGQSSSPDVICEFEIENEDNSDFSESNSSRNKGFHASGYRKFSTPDGDLDEDDQEEQGSSKRHDSRDDSLMSSQLRVRDKIEFEAESSSDSGSSSSASSRPTSQTSVEQADEKGLDDQPNPSYSVSLAMNVSRHNSNASNNKKKSQVRDSRNGGKVQFRMPQDQRRRNPSNNSTESKKKNRFTGHKPKRFRSVQLSSIRTLPATKRKSPTSWVSQKAVYGQRLIEKDGNSNIQVSEHNRVDLVSRYFSDIFTTLLDSSWTWVLSITTAVYIGHWFIFGMFYWIFAILNNDYEKIIGIAASADSNSTTPEGDPCVYNVYDGVSAFLFSLESETTIGYGSRTVTTTCPHAVVCLTLQCIISAIFDTWVIGMCYARMARPDARTMTTLFSKKAVICKRDGKRYLIIRFSNLRKSLLLNVSVRARLITLRGALEKEKTAGFQRMLEQRQVTFENASSALLTAPIEYRHVINKDSPFYRIKPHMYSSESGESYFELVFIVTGTLESTGLTMQAQTSYLSSEILYGHRFLPVVSKSAHRSKYIVDFKHFHDTEEEPAMAAKHHRTTSNFHIRDTSCPLIEEHEDDTLSASDDVFAQERTETQQAESAL